MRCVRFTGQCAISQKQNDICNKTLHLALEYFETVDLEYRSSFSVDWMHGQILVQKSAKFDHS